MPAVRLKSSLDQACCFVKISYICIAYYVITFISFIKRLLESPFDYICFMIVLNIYFKYIIKIWHVFASTLMERYKTAYK